MVDQDGGQGREYSYKMELKGLHDSYFTSLYAAPYLGPILVGVFVVGSVWRIFKW